MSELGTRSSQGTAQAARRRAAAVREDSVQAGRACSPGQVILCFVFRSTSRPLATAVKPPVRGSPFFTVCKGMCRMCSFEAREARRDGHRGLLDEDLECWSMAYGIPECWRRAAVRGGHVSASQPTQALQPSLNPTLLQAASIVQLSTVQPSCLCARADTAAASLGAAARTYLAPAGSWPPFRP